MRAYTRNVNVAGAAARTCNTFNFLRGSAMLRVYTGVYIPRNVYVTSLTIAKYRRTVRCTDARTRVCVYVYTCIDITEKVQSRTTARIVRIVKNCVTRLFYSIRWIDDRI